MQIKINGKPAVMKRGTSFQYVSENRNFTGSDSYTFNITFPLAGCPQNLAIFGHIHRKDAAEGRMLFDCEIIDRDFQQAGALTVMEINDREVKTQFLEGRSVQNFDRTFDDIFINTLNLGEYPLYNKESWPPEALWHVVEPEHDFVALPWVNNASGVLQNGVGYSAEAGRYVWLPEGTGLSCQAYLIYLTIRIFDTLGYTWNFTPWTHSPLRYLLVCNCLPATWGIRRFSAVLPRWSVSEFIRELELLLDAEFDVDHKQKRVTMQFVKDINRVVQPVVLERVTDDFTQQIEKEEDADTGFLLTQNLAYANDEHALSPYFDCGWYIKAQAANVQRYATLAELLDVAQTQQVAGVEISHRPPSGTVTTYCRGYRRGAVGNNLFYAEDVKTYFVMYCYNAVFYQKSMGKNWYYYYFRLMPVNQFGRRIVDEANEEVQELNIVPALILDTEEALGQCIFVEPADFDSMELTAEDGDDGFQRPTTRSTYSAPSSSGDTELTEEYYNNGGLAYSSAGYAIKRGEKKGGGEYFSKIYVAFWDGINRFPKKMPCPLIDRVTIRQDFTPILTDYSLRINEREASVPGVGKLDITTRRKYKFSFLADTLPNPRAVFYIRGQRYVCEKLTATFTERGKSQLIKGEFYRLKN